MINQTLRRVSYVAPLLFSIFVILSSANRPGMYYDTVNNSNNSTFKDVQIILQNQNHQLNNHEEEIRMFDERLKNLDVIIEGMRDEYGQINILHKNQMKSQSSTFSDKITALEDLVQGIVSDMKQFKVYTQEVDALMSNQTKKIVMLENSVALQTDNIKHLQESLSFVINAMQSNEMSTKKTQPPLKETSLSQLYIIKNGDSLEAIAKKHQTTVQAIKSLNGLTNDRIVVGRSLRLPEK